MPAVRWYEPSRPPSQSKQGPRHQTKRPQLSQEARAAIKERRHDNQLKYNTAVAKTVSNFEKAASDVASTHHKSLRRVEKDVLLSSDLMRKRHKKSNAWNAWVWYKFQDKENLDLDEEGKEVLPALIAEHKEEYEKLTDGELKEIISLHEEHKATKATARRINFRSRINDATQTLMAIETEAANLQARAGVELLIFATPGTSDLRMDSYSYATKGVDKFMEHSLKIDSQNFLCKMEGYALQGVYGAAENYKSRVKNVRADIREEIQDQLRDITKDSTARMEYVDYHRKVVRRYQVFLEGWPQTLPFKAPSECSSSFHELKDLLQSLRNGNTYWKTLTNEELGALEKELEEKIASGEITQPIPRRRRSDHGKKRKRVQREESPSGNEEEAPSKQQKTKHKKMKRKHTSASIVDSDDEPQPDAPSTLTGPESDAPLASTASTGPESNAPSAPLSTA